MLSLESYKLYIEQAANTQGTNRSKLFIKDAK